jgi:bifunctional DNA-binding transcriptional regulator/antitoxin component of YhaV-PrlF toxin-antitoxin module
MSDTVKAREHHGAESLDITIPTELVRDRNISAGDIFEIEVEQEDEDLVIRYKRIYQSD